MKTSQVKLGDAFGAPDLDLNLPVSLPFTPCIPPPSNEGREQVYMTTDDP